MSPQELFNIVDPWYQTGVLPDNQKPVIQSYYTELTGDVGERCRTCPNYWNDVQHVLRVHLKSLGFQSMDNSNQQYIIRDDLAFLQIHGLPYAYINKGKGQESESAKFLTDAIAKKLLADKPDLAEVIVKNPDYVAPKAKGSKPNADKQKDSDDSDNQDSDESSNDSGNSNDQTPQS